MYCNFLMLGNIWLCFFLSTFRHYCVQYYVLCNYIFEEFDKVEWYKSFWLCKSVPFMNISHQFLSEPFFLKQIPVFQIGE